MATQASSHKVLVSDLPGDCMEEEVRIVFATYGTVTSIRMLPPGSDGLSGAYVCFDSDEAAEDAEDALDGVYSIRHDVKRPIRVKQQGVEAQQAPPQAQQAPPQAQQAPPQAPPQAQVMAPSYAAAAGGSQSSDPRPQAADAPKEALRGGGAGRQDGGGTTMIWTESGMAEAHKLFIGSLPPDITEEEMKIVFNTYGVVLRVILLNSSPAKGRSAFVMYKDRESGDDAIEVLNGIYKIRGESYPYPLQVRWASKSTRREAWDAASAWDSAGNGWESRSWQGGDWSSGWADDQKGGGRQQGAAWKDASAGWEESSWSSAGGRGKKRSATAEPVTTGTERICASPGCKFRVTWHATHCCYVCEGRPGDHGPKCDRRLPKAGQEAGGRRDSAAPAVSARTAQAGEVVPRDGGAPRVMSARTTPAGEPLPKDAASRGGQAPSPLVHLYANLPNDIEESALKYVFETYGLVTKIRMERHQAAGCAQAFVEFGTAWDAETAVMSLDNQYEIRKGFGPIRAKLVQAKPRGAPY